MTLAKIEEKPGALEVVRERLERWRREQGGRGRRIPPELWAQAARAAAIVGTGETARALRLDERRLGAALEALGHEPGFVEIQAITPLSSSGATVVEIQSRRGDRMRVSIPAGGLHVVVQLLEALLGAGP